MSELRKISDNYVFRNLQDHINVLEKKNTRLKYVTVFLKISIILLGTVSTIILGLNINQNMYIECSRNIAFVFGALITLISAILTTFDIEKFWIKNKLQLFLLCQLTSKLLNYT